ncbi:hypothetical protein DRE_04812 [Drechslerella stenobrocha 248]|uniref:DNA damage-responsive protein 48 n=1 Tax=Drechslerella stenobrocha 248 TaxID=1043628 RepID=W7HS70_9PEZI|nr:hypothetical protein DRE_04812 [Drechslerella stenobrocha 248]
MDFLNRLAGDNKETGEVKQTGGNKESGGLLDQVKNFANEQAGGGKKGEQNEDTLDKAIDMFQDKVLGQGPQDNESAVEQAKDAQIAGFIRNQYKSATGKEFPIEEKNKR